MDNADPATPIWYYNSYLGTAMISPAVEDIVVGTPTHFIRHFCLVPPLLVKPILEICPQGCLKQHRFDIFKNYIKLVKEACEEFPNQPECIVGLKSTCTWILNWLECFQQPGHAVVYHEASPNLSISFVVDCLPSTLQAQAQAITTAAFSANEPIQQFVASVITPLQVVAPVITPQQVLPPYFPHFTPTVPVVPQPPLLPSLQPTYPLPTVNPTYPFAAPPPMYPPNVPMYPPNVLPPFSYANQQEAYSYPPNPTTLGISSPSAFAENFPNTYLPVPTPTPTVARRELPDRAARHRTSYNSDGENSQGSTSSRKRAKTSMTNVVDLTLPYNTPTPNPNPTWPTQQVDYDFPSIPPVPTNFDLLVGQVRDPGLDFMNETETDHRLIADDTPARTNRQTRFEETPPAPTNPLPPVYANYLPPIQPNPYPIVPLPPPVLPAHLQFPPLPPILPLPQIANPWVPMVVAPLLPPPVETVSSDSEGEDPIALLIQATIANQVPGAATNTNWDETLALLAQQNVQRKAKNKIRKQNRALHIQMLADHRHK